MNLAVIGSGGREHSICYKLKQSSKIKKLILNSDYQKTGQTLYDNLPQKTS